MTSPLMSSMTQPPPPLRNSAAPLPHRPASRAVGLWLAAWAVVCFAIVLVGFGAAELFGGAGVAGVWTMLVGWFLLQAADAEARSVVVHDASWTLVTANAPYDALMGETTTWRGIERNAVWRNLSGAAGRVVHESSGYDRRE